MKKIKDSFAGVIIGLILLIGGMILLWWNEGNNVKNIKTVDELRKNYVDIKNSPIDDANEGKLVAVSGQMAIDDETLLDQEFNVEVKTAKLVRVVEMYQWDENAHEEDDITTYTYEKVWKDTRIDSSTFHEGDHQNPEMSYETQYYSVKNIKLGDFSLTDGQINDLSATATFKLENEKAYKDGFKVVKEGKYLTNSIDPDKPEIGDLRISYKYVDYDEISILAVQKGNTFDDYVSKVGKHTNYVMQGIHDGSAIITDIEEGNNTLKWILRLVGSLLIIFGLLAILGPISTLANFVPILGGLVGFALFLVALLGGLAISLIDIALAWLFYRPLLGIILIAVAVALIVLVTQLIKKNKKKEA